MSQSKIVILEKNQHRRDSIRSIVSKRGGTPFIFEKEAICLENLVSLKPDLVISGPMSPERSFKLIHAVKLVNRNLPLVMITDDQVIHKFVKSNGFGDVTVIGEEFKPADIKKIIKKSRRRRWKDTKDSDRNIPLIVGNSPEILKIKQKISELKHAREPVLIQGEPGTGKELVARAIHCSSAEYDSPFVKINLAALSSKALDDIIFKNASSGSSDLNQNVKQIFTAADIGTLFLDEISTVSASQQARLLNFFIDGTPPAYGPSAAAGNHNFTMVAASTIDLEKLISRGEFRKDLFYRLNVVSISIPPLRHRIGDIALLTDFFADKYCMEFGKSRYELSRKAKEEFCRYPWPGNVRELEHIVRRVILAEDEPSVIGGLCAQNNRGKHIPDIDGIENLYCSAGLDELRNKLKDMNNLALKSVRDVFWRRNERKLIKKALECTNWNRKRAAGLLNISYKSILNKMKAHRLL